MAKRNCSRPGCPTLVEAGARSGRCGDCEREADAARGTRQERGYDADYDAERRRWAPKVATGTVTCRRASSGRCLVGSPVIAADEPWNLGHPDADCRAPMGPEHRRCNLATSTRRHLV